MDSWLFIILVLMNSISVLVWFFYAKELRHLVESHTHILGSMNEELVDTWRLKVLKAFYFACVLLSVGFSFAFFSALAS